MLILWTFRQQPAHQWPCLERTLSLLPDESQKSCTLGMPARKEVGVIPLRDKPAKESEEESLTCLSFRADSRKNHPE